MRIIVGIPARMGSSRLPGKPIVKVCGLPLIEHVYKRAKLCPSVDEIFVATCDEEIKQVAEGFGSKVIMTDKMISRPGLRVAAAARELNLNDEDIVVVLQGDEPLFHPDLLEMALKPLREDKDLYVSNLAALIKSDKEWLDVNDVKVVCDNQMNAIYMSRSPIPSVVMQERPAKRYKQTGLIFFKWHFMKKFNDELFPTDLELGESIEMLRAIQHGYKVRMVPFDYPIKSVDTESDRVEAEAMMQRDEIYLKHGF